MYTVVRVLPPGITPCAFANRAADFEPGSAQRRVSPSACGVLAPVVEVMGDPPDEIIPRSIAGRRRLDRGAGAPQYPAMTGMPFIASNGLTEADSSRTVQAG